MKDKIRLKRRKLNESGAALVTVVVVIGFISILVTVILYSAGMNYYMKGTDKEIKDSFYDAESALEIVKADMLTMANDAFQVAYKETVTNVCSIEDGGNLTDEYNKLFVQEVQKKFNLIPNLDGYYDEKVGDKYKASLSLVDPDKTVALVYNESAGTIIVKGFKVSYTKDGYNTEILTDFIIRPPAVEWYANKSETIIGPGVDTSTAFQRKVFDIADCVVYYNWEKR